MYTIIVLLRQPNVWIYINFRYFATVFNFFSGGVDMQFSSIVTRRITDIKRDKTEKRKKKTKPILSEIFQPILTLLISFSFLIQYLTYFHFDITSFFPVLAINSFSLITKLRTEPQTLFEQLKGTFNGAAMRNRRKQIEKKKEKETIRQLQLTWK